MFFFPPSQCCFFHAPKCGTPVVKARGENLIDCWSRGIGDVCSYQMFTLSWHRPFHLATVSTSIRSLIPLLYRGGKETTNQFANRRRGSVSSRSIFQRSGYHGSNYPSPWDFLHLPVVTDWMSDSLRSLWCGGWQTFVWQCKLGTPAAFVLTSSRSSEVSGGTPPVDVKECLWERAFWLLRIQWSRRLFLGQRRLIIYFIR